MGKNGDFDLMTQTLYNRIRKKSLMFIISDFVGDIDLRVLAKKHDVVALIIRDKFEENPQALGSLRLVDMDNKNSYEGDIDGGAVKRYKEALHNNDEKLYIEFKKLGIRFIKIYTNEIPAVKLAKLFI
jgi:hypothetical protein